MIKWTLLFLLPPLLLLPPAIEAQFKDVCAGFLPTYSNIKKHFDANITEKFLKEECKKIGQEENKACINNLASQYLKIIERDLSLHYDHCTYLQRCPDISQKQEYVL